MGLGLIWMLLREHWFATAPAPAKKPSGWTGFFAALFLAVLASLVTSGVVNG